MERKEHSKGERTGGRPQYGHHLSLNTCIPGDKRLQTTVRGRQEILSSSENWQLPQVLSQVHVQNVEIEND